MESETNLLRKNIKRLVDNEIKPEIKEWEKARCMPDQIVKKIAEMGLFGLSIPEEDGGIGYGAEVLTAAVEELARGSASLALIVLIQNSLVAQTLIKSEVKEHLSNLAEGKILGGGGVFETGIEEADNKISGTGDFLINGGGKIFVLSTPDKTYLINDGINRDHCGEVLAFHAADICSFSLKDTPVISTVRSDQIKEGFYLYLLGLSAIALGIAQEILYEVKNYAKNRKQFGKPIIEFWQVKNMLADIATTVHVSELMVKDSAIKYDQGSIEDHTAPLVKAFVTSRVMKSSTLGIQVFGGYGYTTDYPMERYFREAKVLEVLGSVNEELRSRIIQSL